MDNFGVKAAAAGIGVIVLLAFVWMLYPFHQVEGGFVGVKVVFGAPQPGTLDPGLHWQTPFTTTIVDVDSRPQTVSTNETAATHDLQIASTTIAVSYQINPADAVNFYTQYRTMAGLYAIRIAPVVSNDVKEVTASYDSQQLVTERLQVDTQIKDRITSDLSAFDILVSQVNLTNFDFSADYDAAIEAKQVSYQNSLAAQYALDKAKVDVQQGVVTAQANAQATIANAQGAMQATVLQAQGNAQATILQANADAQAFKVKQAALTPNIIAMEYAQHWDGHLPQYMTTPIPFFDPTTKPTPAGQ